MNIQVIKREVIARYKAIDIKELLKSRKVRALIFSISFSLVFFCVLMIIFSIHIDGPKPRHSSTVNKVSSDKSLAQAELSGKLDDINTQLARINQSMQGDSSLSAEDKDALKSKINNISTSIDGLAKESTVTAISGNLANETRTLNQKVNDLNSTIKLIESQVKQGNYISKDNLPFKVESVDIWNGQPFAAVFLGNQTELLAKNDKQMGWEVININYQHQLVTLENDKQQLVRVKVRG